MSKTATGLPTSANVLASQKVAFIAASTSTLNPIVDGTFQNLQFNTVTNSPGFQTGGTNYNVSNYTFTAPVSGYYKMGLNFLFNASGPPTEIIFGLQVASSNFPQGDMRLWSNNSGITGGQYTRSGSTMLRLNYGDTVVSRVNCTNGAINILPGFSFFWGHLIA